MISGEDSDSGFLQAAVSAILDASDEGYVVVDASGRCRMIGRRTGEIFGVDPASQVGRHAADVLEMFALSCDGPDAFWRAVSLAPERATETFEIDVRRPMARTVLGKAVAIGQTQNGTSGWVILLRDATNERAGESSARQLRSRLRALMPFDALTGLLNQRRLYEELGREHSRSARAWDSYALLRIGIDGLKAIQDDFGIRSGDQLLEQVARRLETCVREYDVLARLEGDEFGVLLPGADEIAGRAVGERMTNAVAGEAFRFSVATAPSATAFVGEDDGALRLPEPLLPLPFERTVGVSVGGALWVPPSRQSAEATFRRAGEALREARKLEIGKVFLLAPIK